MKPDNSDKELIFLRKYIEISRKIDAIIESCHKAHRDLGSSLELVFSMIQKLLHPERIFLYTQNEELALTLFTRGTTSGEIKSCGIDLLSVQERTLHVEGNDHWFAMPLDIDGEIIGSFGACFKKKPEWDESELFDLLDAFAEELDNYFFGIHESRFKHQVIIEIQRSLKSNKLSYAIERAINVLSDMVPIEEFVLLYVDEGLSGDKSIQYFVYENYVKIHDSVSKPHRQLDNLIGEGKDIVLPGNKDLEKIFSLDSMSETIMLDGLVVETLVGKLLVKPPKDIGFSVLSREILQVFSESLRQRLVDFNKEKNSLRQFFSNEVTRKLIEQDDYRDRYLSPRKAEIGVIFADISGFTKMSEQVLKEPDRIARFIDLWAKGVVREIFPLGATLDKLVGDCIIILFGPPFYELPPAEIAQRVFSAAKIIRDFTDRFLREPENKVIQESEFFSDFGVAIGASYCSADVGLIGPNSDLTAFSSGVNNTARLQGLAHHGEILVSPSLVELAKERSDNTWNFEGPFESSVKNVKEPLKYYRILG